jgi:hypothetical protein
MANADLEPCVKCDHPNSEHVKGGCNHLTNLEPQEHGNPERLLCSCDEFVAKN